MRINQIITNLVSNAVKFTPAGGSVRLTLSQSGADENKAHIRFKVADTGIGMSRQFLAKIWTLFEQGDSSISRRFGGTGLGLSITKHLVDLMNGSVSVESAEGSGSTFTVELALERMEQPDRESGSVLAGTSEKPDFRGVRILLAEDNEMNMEIAWTILSKWNLTVDQAWNGREAFDMFNSSPAGTYRAILMDIHMPEVDGYTATRMIRESGHADAASVPVIAMTADVFAEDVAVAMAAGVNAHIGKPVGKNVLLDVLRRYCL